MKLAIFTSHPIQYQAPFFRELAAERDLDATVYFNWNFGVGKAQYDPGFNQAIVWDAPLLEGYRYRFLKNFSWRPGSSSFWGEINPGAALAIWRGGYDAVLIYHWNFVTSWIIFAAAFLRGVPVYLRAENPLRQEFSKSAAKLRLKKFILRPLFRRLAGFLYIGKENKAFYEYYGVPAEKLFFSPYAVDNVFFAGKAKELLPRKAELKSRLGISAAAPVILFVGKLNEKKRPLDLLKAYASLIAAAKATAAGADSAASSPDAALVFGGDGVLRQELEVFAKERNLLHVHFEGFKNLSEIPEYYAMADIFVLPSEEGETWGLVVNEAMCFGLPIVLSDMVGCAPDLVDGNGFVVKKQDVPALAAALGELLADPEKRRRYGDRSREIVARYSFAEDIRALREALAHSSR